jgi:SpoIIAA-like
LTSEAAGQIRPLSIAGDGQGVPAATELFPEVCIAGALINLEVQLEQRAISEMPTKRSDLFAFEVDGKIHEKDIEWMARRLKSAFDALGTVDIIIVMTNWDGIDFGAAFDAEGLSAQGKAAKHVRKYAVVGAPGWAAAMINLFSPLSPSQKKGRPGPGLKAPRPRAFPGATAAKWQRAGLPPQARCRRVRIRLRPSGHRRACEHQS